jgi:hypothetical protein
LDNLRLAAEGTYYRKNGDLAQYFDFYCRNPNCGFRSLVEPLRFTCVVCKKPLQYRDDIWWLKGSLESSIDHHKEFFETFARDDGKFKTKFIRQNPSLLPLLMEYHTMALIKLDQARASLEAIKSSADLFLDVGAQVASVTELQKDLTSFFMGLAGSLDVADAQIGILKTVIANTKHFNSRDWGYVKIKDHLGQSLGHGFDHWLWTLSSFRDFLVHRFSLRVLSWTEPGQLSFQANPSNTSLDIFEPDYTPLRKDKRLVRVLIQRLRRTHQLPEKLNTQKVYPLFIRPPIVPIVLLPAEKELRSANSPEEFTRFQNEDVRDFSEKSYSMCRQLLSRVYLHLIRMWRENS